MEHCISIKVYYEDTDCGGVVYYGRYLGFLERARTEFMESRGVNLRALMEAGVSFVVAHVDIRYRASARYGDILSVCSALDEISAATITIRHRIFREEAPDDVLVTASVKLVSVGPAMKPVRMRRDIVDALRGN